MKVTYELVLIDEFGKSRILMSNCNLKEIDNYTSKYESVKELLNDNGMTKGKVTIRYKEKKKLNIVYNNDAKNLKETESIKLEYLKYICSSKDNIDSLIKLICPSACKRTLTSKNDFVRRCWYVYHYNSQVEKYSDDNEIYEIGKIVSSYLSTYRKYRDAYFLLHPRKKEDVLMQDVEEQREAYKEECDYYNLDTVANTFLKYGIEFNKYTLKMYGDFLSTWINDGSTNPLIAFCISNKDSLNKSYIYNNKNKHVVDEQLTFDDLGYKNGR
ncbi:MAG: hypothetical protein Q4G04_03995 [bacterium]|nr:hypothetical protein [bacterium]